MPAHQLPEGWSYPLNLQQVVDLGVAQVIAQGFVASSARGECRYHDEGRACHIGACLPLAVAEAWDQLRALISESARPTISKFFAADIQALQHFQAIHDGWLQPDKPGSYARQVEGFCRNHGLTFPQALAPYLPKE